MNKNDLQSKEIINSIICETKNILKEPEWKIIDGVKKWIRNCPKCNKLIYHKTIKIVNIQHRKNKYCKSCGLTGKIHGAMSQEHKDKISSHHKLFGVGKWMMGRQPSAETKLKISEFHKGKCISHEVRLKISKTHTGMRHSEESKKKISNSGKGRITSEETKEKLRIATRRAIENGKICVKNWFCFNPWSCIYIDALSLDTGWNLQHAENGGEIRCLWYSLDGYDKERNIAFEYDEQRHFNFDGTLKECDVVRMQKIVKELNCQFYRYNEPKNELIRYY